MNTQIHPCNAAAAGYKNKLLGAIAHTEDYVTCPAAT